MKGMNENEMNDEKNIVDAKKKINLNLVKWIYTVSFKLLKVFLFEQKVIRMYK